jgi:hypothetical protein
VGFVKRGLQRGQMVESAQAVYKALHIQHVEKTCFHSFTRMAWEDFPCRGLPVYPQGTQVTLYKKTDGRHGEREA